MIWQGLQKAVDRMERHGCVRCRHDPFVVWLMQRFVNQRVVQSAMDQVDPEIGEDEEQRELEPVVPDAGAVDGAVVELGEAAHFGEEEGGGEHRHEGHAVCGLGDLHPDLVFEEFGVLEGGFVEDEDVREGGDKEVDGGAEDPGGVLDWVVWLGGDWWVGQAVDCKG
jgi:hypothetical protein